MNFWALTLVGIGLSVDSLVASIATGACVQKINIKHTLKVAFFLAFFQGLMPYIGWKVGGVFKGYIESFDHWIAFILLVALGGKLIYDSFHPEEADCNKKEPTHFLPLIMMSIATSIDALIIGVGFGLIDVEIHFAMIIIGIVTFLFASFGVFIGKKIGCRINQGVEIAGGILFFLLGTKILIEHLYGF
ncbi:MAG: manganese efflux pump MntP family protein [Prolixibacteraceae bacterium]|jgi:putative Mn2+ efflux pump MntP|nr:manganese efflux pump MntP family protein [Prolixibacteraceae bacterium]